jgi:hypothetical protein
VHTLARFFHSVLPVCEVLVSAGLDDVLAGLGGGMHMCRHLHAFGACPGGVVVHRAPEPGPAQGDRCELSDLLVRPFTVLPRGQKGEVSTTPIVRVVNHGSLVELLMGSSTGRLCLVR